MPPLVQEKEGEDQALPPTQPPVREKPVVCPYSPPTQPLAQEMRQVELAATPYPTLVQERGEKPTVQICLRPVADDSTPSTIHPGENSFKVLLVLVPSQECTGCA